jgi:hypothetical protein
MIPAGQEFCNKVEHKKLKRNQAAAFFIKSVNLYGNSAKIDIKAGIVYSYKTV